MAGFQEGITIRNHDRLGAKLEVDKRISCTGDMPDPQNLDALVAAFSNAVRLQVARLFAAERDNAYAAGIQGRGASILTAAPDLDLVYKKITELGTSSQGNLSDGGKERLHVAGKVAGNFEVVKPKGTMPDYRGAIIAEAEAVILQACEDAAAEQLRQDLGGYLRNSMAGAGTIDPNTQPTDIAEPSLWQESKPKSFWKKALWWIAG